nr:colorectal mutant cancer protein-like [Biomphalaria glabrata]
MNLPVEWAALSPSGSYPFDKAFGMPSVQNSLLQPEVTKRCDPTRLLQAAREAIASYPAGLSTIYKDGSVQTLEGTVRAGYGAVVRLWQSRHGSLLMGFLIR